MAAEPVDAWDARVLAASEATFGTVPNPAANQAIEFISIDTGNAELGAVRPKKDRNVGRGMTDGYVIGRVAQMPWSLETSVKSRATVDTVPHEAVLYRAAGLSETVNGSSNVTYSIAPNPLNDGFDTGGGNSLQSMSLYRCLGVGSGATTSRYLAEQMRGCIAKTLSWSGGDKELTLKASGDAIGKYTLAYSLSITFADGSATTITFGSAEEAYRFAQGIGWYQIESEIVKITVTPTAGATTGTVARAQLASSGAAHAAKPLVPYLPTLSAYTGSPISEVNCSVTLDSQTIRFQSFTVEFTSGIELGPGETGSKYIQTPIVKRCSAKVTLKGLMRREDLALLGKASVQATPLALSIVCGTGTGSIATFSLPQCEVDAYKVPDNGNDVAYQSLTLRTRDSTSGNDLMTLTLT
jgi:hypothetical protein